MSKRYEILPPAKAPARASPVTTLPDLPSSSGAIWGSAKTLIKKDTEYIKAHTEFLQARSAQATAMTSVINSRHDLALALVRMASLSEIAEFEHRRGRADRSHELAMQGMRHELVELNEEIALINARRVLAALTEPTRPEAPSQAASTSPLTIDDIEQVAQHLPELAPETVQAMILALKGLMSEKRK